jgi:hypothetical protein
MGDMGRRGARNGARGRRLEYCPSRGRDIAAAVSDDAAALLRSARHWVAAIDEAGTNRDRQHFTRAFFLSLKSTIRMAITSSETRVSHIAPHQVELAACRG